MRSIKRLHSVIHSIAHHAISSLCYVHPHLGNACKRLGVKEVSLSLLRPEISLSLDSMPDTIKSSTQALRERFAEILASEQLDISDINTAVATFFYSNTYTWPDACYIRVETTAGRILEDAVGSNGRRANILKPTKGC